MSKQIASLDLIKLLNDQSEQFVVCFSKKTCPYCIALKPALEELSRSVPVYIVDLPTALVEPRDIIRSIFSIDSYPTLYYVSNGQCVKHAGDRSAKALRRWVFEDQL